MEASSLVDWIHGRVGYRAEHLSTPANSTTAKEPVANVWEGRPSVDPLH